MLFQPYLLGITWAIAGIAAEQDYRRERLGRDIADGVDGALQVKSNTILYLAGKCDVFENNGDFL